MRESVSEIGHAVRALYLESGVTDVAVETHDRELLASSVRRWSDMVAAKTYLTGGNGSRHDDEGFGDRFELPPDRAYNETCASIASFHWSWRLLLATGDAKYADHMERLLYNDFAGRDLHRRRPVLLRQPAAAPRGSLREGRPGPPPHLVQVRLLPAEHHAPARVRPALPGHRLASDTLSSSSTRPPACPAPISTSSSRPTTRGRALVTVRVLGAPAQERGLALRIPCWSAAAAVFTINDSPERTVTCPDGYLLIRRRWQAGDEVRLRLDLTPRWTRPDRRVDAVRGCAAIERGPLVYCLEQADQPVRSRSSRSARAPR